METSANEKLRTLYYDPAKGYNSIDKFYKKAKEVIPGITLKNVVEFVEKQKTYQLNKESKKPKEFSSIIASAVGDNFQVDIMVYDRFELNKYKYILCVVDVHSRFAQTRALTNRENRTILNTLEKIFSVMGTPKNINADNEFNKEILNKFFQKEKITCYFSEVGQLNKNAIVERFNRTLAGFLQKARTAGQKNWVKILPEITDNYNNTYHRTIKAKPVDVFTGKATNMQQVKIVTPPTLSVGDIVRYKTTKKLMQKGDYIKYSEDEYRIVKVEKQKVYLVNVRTGEPASRSYRPYEVRLASTVEELPIGLQPKNDEYIMTPKPKPSQRKAMKELETGLKGWDVSIESKRVRKPKVITNM